MPTHEARFTSLPTSCPVASSGNTPYRKTTMKKHLLLVSALAAICGLMLTACQYHWGSSRPEGLYGLDVGVVTNLTREGALTAAFRKSIQEHISTDPGLSSSLITHQLNVELENLYQKNIARAELRDRDSREDDSAAYQTVLYRLELRARYTVCGRNDTSATPVLTGTVIGRADIPRMHDMNVPFQAACQQAADDAARQIVAAVVESASLKP